MWGWLVKLWRHETMRPPTRDEAHRRAYEEWEREIDARIDRVERQAAELKRRYGHKPT